MITTKALLLVSLISIALSSPCSDFIERMNQRRINNTYTGLTPDESSFLQYSATNINVPGIGNKDECRKQPGMKYFMAVRIFRFKSRQVTSTFSHAVCLPAYCADPSVPANNTVMRTLFVAREWIIDLVPLYEEHYRLVEPSDWDLPAFFYPTLLLILAFTITAVYSTIYLYRQRKSSNSYISTEEKKVCSQWLIEAFDYKRNSLDLYKTAKEQKINEDLAVFQFFRAVSCFWVAYFHVCIFATHFYIRYWEDSDFIALNRSPIGWLNTQDGVENFYFMGGFFAIYALTPKLASIPFGVKVFLEQVKHRALRIWPVYMIAVLIFSQLGPYLSSGEAMTTLQSEVTPCYNWINMIAKALFLDTLLNPYIIPMTGGLCMGSTYYISLEFQIHWFSILVIALYAKHRKSGRALVIGLILQSAFIAMKNHYKYDFFTGDYIDFWWKETKYFRIPCIIWYMFFMGALWGLLYHEYSRLNKKNIYSLFEKSAIASYASMALGVLIFVDTRGFYIIPWDEIPGLAYPVLRSIMYTLSMGLFYAPIITTRPSLIKKIMNWRVFQIIGKTSFMFYLSHDWVFRNVIYGPSKYKHYSYWEFFSTVIIVILLTQVVAFWFHLSIEKPLLNIEMHFTKKNKSASNKDQGSTKNIQKNTYTILREENGVELSLGQLKSTENSNE